MCMGRGWEEYECLWVDGCYVCGYVTVREEYVYERVGVYVSG